MELFKVRPKVTEVLFFITGAGMLLTMPWMEQGGFKLWFSLKMFYFIGIIIFLFERIREQKKTL